MSISPDSRTGRVQLAHEYLHEARVAWASVPWDVSTITATQAVGLAHAVELTVKAGVLYANETPAADHGLDSIWARVPVDPVAKAIYDPIVRQAALIRPDGGYPRSAGHEAVTEGMDPSRWTVFRSEGQALTAVIEGVGRFLAGEGPCPPTWRGPGRPRAR